MIRRVRTNYVLAGSIFLFACTIAIIPILEVATGGTRTQVGKWTPMLLFAIFPIVGLFHGSIELIRRIIPNDIVGGDDDRLKKMDSTVHITYEIAGTSGALLATFWITYFKYAYALFLLPCFFTIATVSWTFVRLPPAPLSREARLKSATESGKQLNEKGEVQLEETTFLQDLKSFFHSFFYSVYIGGKLVLQNRSLIWLIPAYTVPLVLHRYLENVLFPYYAKFVLKTPAYSQILLGGSNLGELIGAAFVLMFANKVKTPLPWLRSDAFTLLIVWILAYAKPFENLTAWIWTLFPIMSCISFGWAAGDVSLAAYVQGRLSHLEKKEKKTSPLGAVMSFLYVSYIVLFPILSYGMGIVMDRYKATDPQAAFIYIGGVFMTVVGFFIFLATFIPEGSFAFNPDAFDGDIVFNGEVIKRLSDEEYEKQNKEKSADGNMVELVSGM